MSKTNFEKVTASPEALGEFLATLPIALYFERKQYGDSLQIRSTDFRDTVYRQYGKEIKFYDDYKEAMAEVRRLNAAERKKQNGAADNG